MGNDHDILVISDLHLGEDLRAGIGQVPSPQLEALELELAAFLRHYGSDGKRWRLVINGDMVDFLSVCIRPDQAGKLVGWNETDHFYGLGSGRRASETKMLAVVDRHRCFFSALSTFVAAGNDVAIVVGNHDREFHWTAVQEAFRSGVQRHWPEAVPLRELEEVVVFHEWFYYEEGRVWAEHGHQYDAYCSYDTILDPIDPAEGGFEENLAAVSMRYVGNQMPGNPEDRADLSFVDYIHMTFSSGPTFAAMILTGYAVMIQRMVAQWVRRVVQPGPYAERQRRHHDRMGLLAQRNGLTAEILDHLFILRKRPMFVELAPLLRSLMLMRLMLTVGTVIGLPLLVWHLPLASSLVVVPAVLVALVLAHVVLAAQRENVDPTHHMVEAAAKIAALVRAPLVVFGHSHHALARRVSGAWYFNTGTWVGDGEAQVRVFTHLLIQRTRNGARATLCRWRNGQSRELRAERVN